MKKILATILFVISAPSFAGYCFTFNKKINTCDPQIIQSMIDVKDSQSYGVVIIQEYPNSSTIKTAIIYPKNAPAPLGGTIDVSQHGYKVSGNSYEETDREGCIERGSYKETKDSIVTTPKSQAGNCDYNKKSAFALTKGSTTTMRKISY